MNDHTQHESANKVAFSATLHCLTGCAIGEVLGLVIGTALGWAVASTIVLAVVLAFTFGYALSMFPLIRGGLGLRKSLRVALAADTASITVMEISDNIFILLVPGAIYAGLDSALFWVSLVLALLVAFCFAFPLNKYLISKGRGHALMHKYHKHEHN